MPRPVGGLQSIVGLTLAGLASQRRLRNNPTIPLCGGVSVSKSEPGFDFDRYRQLLAEATDEPKRMALIDLLVVEGARAKLAAHRFGSGRARRLDLPKGEPNGPIR